MLIYLICVNACILEYFGEKNGFMKYKHIFWDWNGTLLDDALAACNAVNVMLDNRKLPRITFGQYRDYIDVPIVRFYEKVMDMSKESMELLSVEFNSLFRSFLSESPLSLGAKEVLSAFSSLGIKQYIFSSSENKHIEPFLQKCEIEKYFISVIGASDCYVGSKAERTRAFLVQNGIDPNEAVFVGDMVHDCDVASFIGSDCILVSAGHQSEKALLQTGREVVSSLPELYNKIINSVG